MSGIEAGHDNVHSDDAVHTSLIVFGCAMEIVGYAFRLRASSNPFLLISFVLQCEWPTIVYWLVANSLGIAPTQQTL